MRRSSAVNSNRQNARWRTAARRRQEDCRWGVRKGEGRGEVKCGIKEQAGRRMANRSSRGITGRRGTASRPQRPRLRQLRSRQGGQAGWLAGRHHHHRPQARDSSGSLRWCGAGAARPPPASLHAHRPSNKLPYQLLEGYLTPSLAPAPDLARRAGRLPWRNSARFEWTAVEVHRYRHGVLRRTSYVVHL